MSPAAVVPSTSPEAAVSDSVLIGDWRFRAETGDRDIEGTLRFRREGGELIGQYISPNGSATLLSNLFLSGNRISWDLVTPRTTWRMNAIFSADWMNGTFQTATRTVQWTATKGAAAAPPPSPRP